MAKQTFEEKRKKQQKKLMGENQSESKEYIEPISEKDKFVEQYKRKGYKIILENNTPIIYCKDRKEMIEIKDKMKITNFSFGFRFSPSKYDDLEEDLVNDKIPISSKGKNKKQKQHDNIKMEENIPIKEELQTEIDTSDTTSKADIEKPKSQKRGRPKKADDEKVILKDDVTTSVTVPKKRGRPKKNIENNEDIKISDKPKAKRGRPKKVAEIIEDVPVKKKRGRPKKTNIIIRKIGRI